MNIKNQSVTVWYLVLVALIDFMGLGVVVTVFPHLLLENATGIFPSDWTYNYRLTLLGIFLAIYPLGQFFGAAILGRLSDIHGRKKIMLITLLGTIIAFLASGYAIYIGSALLLFISRAFSGLCAGNIAVAQASMSDISTKATKTKNLTLIQIALGLAWVIGPPSGGWLTNVSIAGLTGFITPFLFIAILLIILLLYTLFGYQETLKSRSKDKVNFLSGLKQIGEAYSHPTFRIAFVIWSVFVAGWWLFEAFLPAYLLHIFKFSSGEIGTFLASMGATYALFQYLVVRPISKKVRPENMVRYSLVLSGISVIAITFVHSVVLLHIFITLFVTSMGFALPGLITSISNLAPEHQQGKIMGTISSVQALATVLVMAIGGYLDSVNIVVTVIGGGLLLLISWVLFFCCFHKNSKASDANVLREEILGGDSS